MAARSVHVPENPRRRQLQVERLFRYMPLEACRDMVTSGHVRVSASTKFDHDTGLSQTRRDNEQKKAVGTRVSEVLGTSVVHKGVKISVTWEGEDASGKQIKVESEVEDPFWILSLSTDLRLGLFEDFVEDAAVEILDVEEFLLRLKGASSELLRPGDIFDHGLVTYADEYVAYGRTVIRVSPFFHKGNLYRGHKEYRVVWHPRLTESEHDFLDLGSLDGIAKVVCKEELMNGSRSEVTFPDYGVER